VKKLEIIDIDMKIMRNPNTINHNGIFGCKGQVSNDIKPE
jgi:hypothetical protein